MTSPIQNPMFLIIIFVSILLKYEILSLTAYQYKMHLLFVYRILKIVFVINKILKTLHQICFSSSGQHEKETCFPFVLYLVKRTVVFRKQVPNAPLVTLDVIVYSLKKIKVPQKKRA